MGFNLHRILQAIRGQPAPGPTQVLAPSRAFRFYTSVDRYTGVAARSLGDFSAAVASIDVASLEFHVRRRDFENWFAQVWDDRGLAATIARIRDRGLRGDALRRSLTDAMAPR